jgi:hypothetical protein
MRRHELTQFRLHFGPDFAAHPHVEHQPRIAGRQSTELCRWQILFAQKAFDEAVDVHDVSSGWDSVSLARIS